MFVNRHCILCGQSYKVSMIVNYDSRVVPDLKIHHNILQSRNLRLQSLDKIGHWCRNIWSANRLCHNQILPQKPNDFFLKKMVQPKPLFRLFSVFSNKQQSFNNKSMCKNVMSIQYTVPGFEPQLLEHESSPIPTRPGLPPSKPNDVL